LLSKGYDVWGTSRDPKINPFPGLKKLGVFERVKLRLLKPEDFNSVLNMILEINPQEIYYLAAQSSVGISYTQPLETMASIASGTLNHLEAIRIVDKSIRFYLAGSSECFGDTGIEVADENTYFNPQSPYAVAKAAATWQVSVYRKSYDLYACTGILFNHESSLRAEHFVTRKIVTAVKRIAAGSNEKLKLGNIEIERDWGWAPEYVEAMWKMLNRDVPEDFVIATGQSQTLQQFVEFVFEEASLNWRDHVSTDSSMLRPSDPIASKANPSKARELLDWKPTIYGEQVPRKMYQEELNPT
jgi:GDPmannose 4,6-dehydratase